MAVSTMCGPLVVALAAAMAVAVVACTSTSTSVTASGAGGATRVGQLNVGGQIYTVNQQAAPTPNAPAPAPTPSPTPAHGAAPTPTPHEASFVGTVTNVSGKCPNLTFIGDDQ
jgi:hypothetical protein